MKINDFNDIMNKCFGDKHINIKSEYKTKKTNNKKLTNKIQVGAQLDADGYMSRGLVLFKPNLNKRTVDALTQYDRNAGLTGQGAFTVDELKTQVAASVGGKGFVKEFEAIIREK